MAGPQLSGTGGEGDGQVLVGREDELAELVRHLRADRPIAVVGESGIGKTAILRAAAAQRGGRLFEGGGLASLRWHTYLPLTRALRRPLPAGDPPALVTFVRRSIGAGALLLDDLHWADAATLELLPWLAPAVPLLLGTRSTGDGAQRAMASIAAAGCAVVGLDRLTDDDAGRLVLTLRPDLPRSELAKIIMAAGGNPFLLEEQALRGAGSVSLGAAVAEWLRECSRGARQALAALGLLGRPASTALIGRVLPELVRAQLVVVQGDQVSVRHSLVADAVVAELTGVERRRLHSQLASALHDPGEAARHFAAAGRYEEAKARALAAAAASERPAERGRHLALAAQCAAGAPADELRLQAAQALFAAGEAETAARLAEQVAGRPALAGAARLLAARAYWTLGQLARAADQASTALAAVGDQPTPVEAQLRIEQARHVAGIGADPNEALALASEAVALAEHMSVGTPAAYEVLGTALLLAGRPDCLETLQRALADTVAAGDQRTAFLAADALVQAHAMFGEPSTAHELAVAYQRQANAALLRGDELHFAVATCALDLGSGCYDDLLVRGLSLLEEPMHADDADSLRGILGVALADRADYAAAEELLRSVDDRTDGWVVRWARAEAAWLSGQPARALSHLVPGMPRRPALAALARQRLVLRAWCLRDSGRPLPPPEPPDQTDPVACEAAGVRALSGQSQSAGEYFGQAASEYAGRNVRGQVRCLWAAGEAARLGGDASATERLEKALQLADSIGLVGIAARARRSLRALGRAVAAPTSAGDGLLTPREREVLGLVSRGMSSGGIARQLAVSPSTVETQIKSAVRKLKATNRRQAAVLAAERGGAHR